jgi:hypothetical protein
MLIVQLCSLSSVVLRPSTKLLNLMCPIPGTGSVVHLSHVKVDEANHHEALKRVLHFFNLKKRSQCSREYCM